MEEIKLTLTLNDVNIILNSLGEVPYKVSKQVIDNIVAQAQPQIQPQGQSQGQPQGQPQTQAPEPDQEQAHA